jgi:hypothetical protein
MDGDKMTEQEIMDKLYAIGIKRMSLRRKMAILKQELKTLEKEFKVTDKELFDIRSSKEYDEYTRKATK